MQTLGVEWVPGDLDKFVASAKRVFGDPPPSGPSKPPKLTVHGIPVEVDRATVANVTNRYSLLDNGMLTQQSGLSRGFRLRDRRLVLPLRYAVGLSEKGEDYLDSLAAAAATAHLPSEFTQRLRNTNSSDNIVAALIGGARIRKDGGGAAFGLRLVSVGQPRCFRRARAAGA